MLRTTAATAATLLNPRSVAADAVGVVSGLV